MVYSVEIISIGFSYIQLSKSKITLHTDRGTERYIDRQRERKKDRGKRKTQLLIASNLKIKTQTHKKPSIKNISRSETNVSKTKVIKTDI